MGNCSIQEEEWLVYVRTTPTAIKQIGSVMRWKTPSLLHQLPLSFVLFFDFGDRGVGLGLLRREVDFVVAS